jgi:serine/threonine protein kinase/Flp pilus assembly protein TadD
MPAKAQDDDLVMNLVELALARPSEEREDYLRSVCGVDSDLLNQVQYYVRWEERMNGFLLDPLYTHVPDERPFEPGQLLDERFRIVREVAEGGMGVVYEAVDEKLERRIAIKCAKTGFRKRLPPEVRNASEISHPNVCKIFEIHTTSTDRGDIDFLTMEFLEGETLAERLRRGPLPELEARTIARQLSEGLAEAHRKRVIHGDLKSNNVILTRGSNGATRAVITDFGLARGPEAIQRNVQSGELAGTPDYMAPELWKGQKASVASDLYALGVILYELASGHRPFGLEVGFPERLTRKPAAVHAKWDRILARCLDPDPARRFRDAEEVARALAPSHARRWFLAAVAALVLAILSGVVTYQQAIAPQELVRLAILPFETDQNTAKFSEGLLRDTASQLARLKGNVRTKVAVVPVSDALRKHADTIDKARTLLGATHVLHATLSQSDGNIAVRAYFTDARSGVNNRDWIANYTSGQLRYAPVALAGLVTETLRLPPLGVAATVNAAAKQDYWNGLWYLRHDSGADAARALLERAVASDSDSALTYAGLAEAQRLKYLLTRDQIWLEGAKESVRQAEGRAPDLPQVHRIAGLLRYEEGWYEQATAEYMRAIELDPSNGDAHRRLGQAYAANNQLEQALQELHRAIDVDPGNYRNYQELGNFYFKQADYMEAAKHLAKMVQLAPEEPMAHHALGENYMNLGRFSEAENEFRWAIRVRETPAELHTLGTVLMYERREQDAISYISRAVSLGPERVVWWMNLGTAYRRVNLKAESEKANRRALELAESQLTLNPRDAKTRSYMAYLSARLGDRKRAESDIAQARQGSPFDADVLWMAAATYEALGKRDATLGVLSAAPTGVIADFARWPDAADLLQDSRFLQLLASRQIR